MSRDHSSVLDASLTIESGFFVPFLHFYIGKILNFLPSIDTGKEARCQPTISKALKYRVLIMIDLLVAWRSW